MSSPPLSPATSIPVSGSDRSQLISGDFEDIDYFLHPRNASEFRQVVRNLHLACFWYSARDMGVAECLNRSRVHLTENQGMTDEGKHALAEAISHLKRALDAPGWQEWMMNGVSIPFGADEWFPLAVRRAWSDSMKEDPDAIDAHSLELLRRANTNGKEDRDLLIAGEEHKARKWSDEVEEMEKAEMRAARHANHTTGQAAAANAPTAAPKVSPRKGSAKRSRQNEERIDEQLAEAAMNAARQVLPPRRSDLPRPLPSIIHIKSRSAKQNFVVDAILTAEPSDKFVIFGDIFEFGHLSEALDLFDVK